MKNTKWQKTKAMGKLKFTIIYGLFFSIISSCFYVLYINLGSSQGSLEDHLIILGVLVISGPIWSSGYWNQMNKKYPDE